MSIAHIERSVSLREVAAACWQRQQDEEAERKRQEIERAADRLQSEIHRALRLLTATYEPASPYDETDVRCARIGLEERTDGVPYAADVLFAGEWFHFEDGVLLHVWTCPQCEQPWEPPTAANAVRSLADLGYWLEFAPSNHRCEVDR